MTLEDIGGRLFDTGFNLLGRAGQNWVDQVVAPNSATTQLAKTKDNMLWGAANGTGPNDKAGALADGERAAAAGGIQWANPFAGSAMGGLPGWQVVLLGLAGLLVVVLVVKKL